MAATKKKAEETAEENPFVEPEASEEPTEDEVDEEAEEVTPVTEVRPGVEKKIHPEFAQVKETTRGLPAPEVTGTVNTATPAPSKRSNPRGKKAPRDFATVPYTAYPMSAVSDRVVGAIRLGPNASPIVELSLLGWVGPPGLVISGNQLDDLEKVLIELRAQIEKA